MTTRPHQGTRLTGPGGNNAFAYEQRKRTDPDPQLRLPELKTISSIEEIELGTLPTFTELNDHEKVVTYTGLKHIYHVSSPPLGKGGWGGLIPPIYILDNHNYALYFWARQWEIDNHPYTVIHIDQHSDLGTPPEPLIIKDVKNYVPTQWSDITNHIAHYTTHVCNVGNFIRPALDAGIISEYIRIKNEYDLKQTGGSYPPLQKTKKNLPPSQEEKKVGYILDIDLDFRAPGMGTDLDLTIPLVQSLIRKAKLITIASSPYFLNQECALKLLERLFT